MVFGKPRIGRAAWALVALGVTACGVDIDARGGRRECAPGVAVQCTCPDGTPSMQQCEAAIGSFAACACSAAPVTPPSMPAANAGAGGSAAPSTPSNQGASAMPTAGTMAPEMTAGTGGMAMAGAGGAGGAGGVGGVGGAAGAAGATPVAGTGGTPGDGEEVPATEHCAAAANWDPMWVQFEEEVLLLTNEARAQGASCGSRGMFGPAEPLAMQAQLRCSARLHSMDMGKRAYFAHDTPDGIGAGKRMTDAGYAGNLMGENIAKGQQTPAEVVEGWMNSEGHCTNIMQPDYADIGIGYWQGASESQWFNGNKLWTQNFGAPATGGWPRR